MVIVGDSVMLTDGSSSTLMEIEKISRDGGYILLIDKRGALQENKMYNMTVIRKGRMLSGGGTVAKIRAAKSRTKEPKQNTVEYVIKIVRPFILIQSRNAFRYDCYIPATISVFEIKDLTIHNSQKAHVSNLSTGGAKILTNEKMAKNKVIQISTTLVDAPLELLGVVVNSEENQASDGKYKYVMRVKFAHITEKDEEMIVGFIFEKFRRERRKQLQRKRRQAEEGN